MRRAERRTAYETRPRKRCAGGAVDASGFEGGGIVEVRQQPRKATSKHRLACARWADEQDVVPARRRDLEGEPCQRLAADVDEVGRGRWGWIARAGRRIP